jgi:hypothetical protein
MGQGNLALSNKIYKDMYMPTYNMLDWCSCSEETYLQSRRINTPDWTNDINNPRKKKKKSKFKYGIDEVVYSLEHGILGSVVSRRTGKYELPYYTIDFGDRGKLELGETDIQSIDELPLTPITKSESTIKTPNRNMDIDEYDSWESIKNTQSIVGTLQERADATMSDIDSLTERIRSCEGSIAVIQNRDCTDCGTIDDRRIADIEERVVDIEQKHKKSSKLAKLAILSRLL